MRHDGHQVNCLVCGSFFHLQSVGQATVVIARVSYAANDGDGNFFDAVCTVQTINGTDQAGCIT